ncbi:alpha/beta hydrolase [Pseudonocardia xinjiangensis]|uniref:alpha/beta hydrolase n=1 Tax=Pseudonocardia xinjiangensis TaxID=75289 RepID=UPI001B7CFA8C|nr:alpha/beta hydrolase [Pseudonocardia xinjiangensis]
MFPVRSTVAAALVAASLVLVGACGAPVAQIGSPPPSGLAGFYGQQVVFEPCAPYATSAIDQRLYANSRFDCARVQVPLDYADPDGPRGEVALLRAKARGEKIGSLLVNPGGPGGSGMNFVATLGPVWDNGQVGERFDVIGFDPRGVGASTPRVECFTDAETDGGEPPAAYLFDVPDEQAAAEVARRCTERTGGVDALTSVGSADVVRDMDVLRAVLGDEKLSYLGYSYGSELGGMYAEVFGRNLRAMVIDGAVDPERSEADFRLTQFVAFQGAFDELAVSCAADAACPLGTDPARATAAFQDLVRPLQDRPAPTADGRALTYPDAIQAVQTALFAESQRPMILHGLAELSAGRGDILLGMRDAALGRGPDGRYGAGLNIDANLAIRCMDNPRRSPEENTELARQARAAAPFLDPGRSPAPAHYECAAWPEPPSRDLPWLDGGVDVPPTLTVSVTGDPGTPYQGGITLARLLGGSLLTVEGAQHGVALFGQSTCVDQAVTEYLIDLRTPPADVRCTL